MVTFLSCILNLSFPIRPICMKARFIQIYLGGMSRTTAPRLCCNHFYLFFFFFSSRHLKKILALPQEFCILTIIFFCLLFVFLIAYSHMQHPTVSTSPANKQSNSVCNETYNSWPRAKSNLENKKKSPKMIKGVFGYWFSKSEITQSNHNASQSEEYRAHTAGD